MHVCCNISRDANLNVWFWASGFGGVDAHACKINYAACFVSAGMHCRIPATTYLLLLRCVFYTLKVSVKALEALGEFCCASFFFPVAGISVHSILSMILDH